MRYQHKGLRQTSTALKPAIWITSLAIWASFLATARAADENFKVVEYEQRAIYHSPQTPGFTSWAGAWTMPDHSLMVCFTQATGPVEGRPRAPKEV